MPNEQQSLAKTTYLTQVRRIVARHGNLSVSVDSLKDDADLYLAGLTSLAAVTVMLALENHFDIEFHDAKLGRMTFSSIEAIAQVVDELKV
jgi:acyl carrier protein